VVSRQDLEDLTKRGHLTLEAPPKSSLCGALMDDWEKSLTNRSAADDRSRIKRHVRPEFKNLRISDVTVASLMD